MLAGRTLACGLSLAVLGISGFAWYTTKELDGVNRSHALDQARKNAPQHLDSSVNILLIGLDSRKNMDGTDLPKQFVEDELHAGSSEIGGYNTNSLIVLHIPPSGKAQAVSVPRDDWVQTYNADGTEGRMHKVKEAYGYAKEAAEQKLRAKGLGGAELEQQSREAGRSATIQTVQKLLDIPIDHFAEVNLIGFYDIAKALEPIPVCLNKAVDDPIVSRITDSKGNVIRPGGGTGLQLPAGVSQLNAADALSFVRQRHNLTNGDLDRTHRQQAFIASVEYKLKQQGVFGDLGRMQALLDVVKKDVVIDDRWRLLDFVQQAPNLTGGNVEFNTLPIDKFATIGGQEVNQVDPVKLRRIVKQLFGQPVDADPAVPVASPSSSSSPSPGSSSSASPSSGPGAGTGEAPVAEATVDVLNGSPVSGAAAEESKALVALGHRAGRIGTADTRPRTTTVKYGAGAQDAGRQIADHYGVTATASSALAPGHVQVVLGADRATPDAGTGTGTTGEPSPGPSATPQMQGPPVRAGGVPCVD
ncbi:putative lytR family regulatory protein [Kitasatospora setae KM-6054]|uniref:Putative lytR family regulatory protein n=1 Tax=Kitasatospora setae (strain ATCC 33774 / DSM 43861 / JCM 3304 / KCC A-0304 / NBRC 14216 / KM-6054) TaxID=452652 RepID=E4N4B0_KITSK|nr:putative lytR family regulatory protein [Kitasatospora setae KM-6054]